jgi:hypothetical protein
MLPGRIRTNDLSRRAAADESLRPRGLWDRQCVPDLSKMGGNLNDVK